MKTTLPPDIKVTLPYFLENLHNVPGMSFAECFNRVLGHTIKEPRIVLYARDSGTGVIDYEEGAIVNNGEILSAAYFALAGLYDFKGKGACSLRGVAHSKGIPGIEQIISIVEPDLFRLADFGVLRVVSDMKVSNPPASGNVLFTVKDVDGFGVHYQEITEEQDELREIPIPRDDDNLSYRRDGATSRHQVYGAFVDERRIRDKY